MGFVDFLRRISQIVLVVVNVIIVVSHIRNKIKLVLCIWARFGRRGFSSIAVACCTCMENASLLYSVIRFTSR